MIHADPMARIKIFEQIEGERVYQDSQWGVTFDDKNTLNDWSQYTSNYLAEATMMTMSPDEQRKYVLKAAAILVAAIEAFDRNNRFAPRHYEDRVPNNVRPGGGS
jgi:hypothetical protein